MIRDRASGTRDGYPFYYACGGRSDKGVTQKSCFKFGLRYAYETGDTVPIPGPFDSGMGAFGQSIYSLGYHCTPLVSRERRGYILCVSGLHFFSQGSG
jgi:hypothetical protein